MHIIKAVCILLVCSFCACSDKQIPANKDSETSSNNSSMQQNSYYVPQSGLVLYADNGTIQNQAFACARFAACMEPMQNGAVIAINREGLFFVRKLKDTGLPHVSIDKIAGNEAKSFFAGRTVSGSWNSKDKAFFLLTRHPIFEIAPNVVPHSVIIETTATNMSPSAVDIGPDVYALFPLKNDTWYVQYRSEQDDKVNTSYAEIKLPSLSKKLLTRTEFEKAVYPLSVKNAPPILQDLFGFLAGAVFVKTKMPDGTVKNFARGDPSFAINSCAHITATQGLVATDDWRVLVYANNSVKELYPSVPVPDAVIKDALLMDGLVVLIWESGVFPNISTSGFLIMPL